MMRTMRRYRYVFPFLFILLALTLGGWGWLAFSHFQELTPRGSTPERVTPTAEVHLEKKLRAGTRLVIPAIHVNAPVEAVGITADGTMDVPRQQPWDGVGWYTYGTYPGEIGSAVMDGHLDRPGGRPAVFWRLRNLHTGDAVLLVDDEGKTLRFRVTDIEIYTPQNAPRRTIFGKRSGSFLNLITCVGTWIPSLQQTTQRLVVYTTMV